MKIKVCEASGVVLDWLVAKCEGKNGVLHDDGITRCIVIAAPSGVYKGIWKPHFIWAQGGPIIEREKIRLDPRESSWHAQIWSDNETEVRYCPTPLVAAMRCYVTSKLGDEVEVPDEL